MHAMHSSQRQLHGSVGLGLWLFRVKISFVYAPEFMIQILISDVSASIMIRYRFYMTNIQKRTV